MNGTNFDKEAFQKILDRLQGDVGRLMDLVDVFNNKQDDIKEQIFPFWAFTRMLFPIAESIGDLIYHNLHENGTPNTSQNLIDVLKNEFEDARNGYKKSANIIALLFRHSLVHTDEMRKLVYEKKQISVGWTIGFGVLLNHHLEIRKNDGGLNLRFDLMAFYEDIVKVCKKAQVKAIAGTWNGVITTRYKSWLELKLDDTKLSHQKAINEIEVLMA